jgi:hypothetical protein
VVRFSCMSRETFVSNCVVARHYRCQAWLCCSGGKQRFLETHNLYMILSSQYVSEPCYYGSDDSSMVMILWTFLESDSTLQCSPSIAPICASQIRMNALVGRRCVPIWTFCRILFSCRRVLVSNLAPFWRTTSMLQIRPQYHLPTSPRQER